MGRGKRYFLAWVACVIIFITAIGFAARKDLHMNSMEVEIASAEGLDFIDEEEVIELMRGEENELSLPVSKWDMSEMERRVEANPFVLDAQVYRDVKGNVLVKVDQRKPVARMYHEKVKDKYIDANGNLLPTAARFTARVPLIEITGLSWDKNLNETEYGKDLLALLNFIEKDEFWRAQIAHVYVDSKGNIEMIPQVTKQKIEFGMPEDIEKKFDKLMLFYKKILPVKGWNTYTTVNLKFKDQIICE